MMQSPTHPDVLALIRADLRQRQTLELLRGRLATPKSKLKRKDLERLIDLALEEVDKVLTPEIVIDYRGEN